MSTPQADPGYPYRAKLIKGGWVRIVYAHPDANKYVYIETREDGSQRATETGREAFEELDL